ncbi:MAG: hypothetical protein JRG94_25755, partial [Deltaproteobacteria bacterium]|nr:hypothetical protein [Deltaproteobacteria bacterium]
LEIVGDYWARTIADEPELFVRYLIDEKKTSVQTLVKLIGHAGTEESLLLIPDSRPVAADEKRLDELSAAWFEAFDAVSKAWTKVGADVISQLHAAASGGDLHKGSYKPDAIEQRWAGEMDGALADPSPMARDRE